MAKIIHLTKEDIESDGIGGLLGEWKNAYDQMELDTFLTIYGPNTWFKATTPGQYGHGTEHARNYFEPGFNSRSSQRVTFNEAHIEQRDRSLIIRGSYLFEFTPKTGTETPKTDLSGKRPGTFRIEHERGAKTFLDHISASAPD